jgi:hypothetical protein
MSNKSRWLDHRFEMSGKPKVRAVMHIPAARKLTDLGNQLYCTSKHHLVGPGRLRMHCSINTDHYFFNQTNGLRLFYRRVLSSVS